jgi:hypothetical protein
VKTISTAGVPIFASANWRDHVPDGLVTVTKKSWSGVLAQTEDGKITTVKPEHLSPAEDTTVESEQH